MQIKIIGISGKAESGKTTVSNILKTELELQGKRVAFINYADYLKFILKQYFNWDGNKDEQGRKMLQYVGTERGRKVIGENFWVDNVINTVKIMEEVFDYVIVGDCRFPNEYDRWAEKGEKILKIKVIRPNYDNHLTDVQRAHASETALDNYKDCLIINNDGTEQELREKVKRLINESGFFE